ncbi:hypothetical protein [Emticicia sp. SJ17W-69]|uniref:hypothetical protein n=1 Tax=Emticicia sp. SJ17W-69 TaxID=3421657 RepID=UPI003EBF228E
MKMTIITFLITFLMVNCQLESSQAINPEMSKLNGKWKLSKIGYGFPAPNGPTEYKPTYEEVLDFNFSTNAFTRTKDGKVEEISNIKTSKLTDGGTSSRDIIIFEKDSTYSFYSFTENPIYLVLYQAAPIGSVLADGNSYFYEKVK